MHEAGWAADISWLARQPAAQLPSLIAKAEKEYSATAIACRARRQQDWQKWVDSALADGSGRLYRWIKGGGGSATALVPDPAACEPGQERTAAAGSKAWLLALRGGPATQLRHL